MKALPWLLRLSLYEALDMPSDCIINVEDQGGLLAKQNGENRGRGHVQQLLKKWVICSQLRVGKDPK